TARPEGLSRTGWWALSLCRESGVGRGAFQAVGGTASGVVARRAASGLEESGRHAVGGAQREGERPGEERRERAPQTSATPRRNPRRERRPQRREARERTGEDLELNDLPLLVEAQQIDGFELHPANARAKGERSRIAERERFGGVEVLEDGEDVAVQCRDLLLALEPYSLCHRGVKDDVGRQELADCIGVAAFPGGAQGRDPG